MKPGCTALLLLSAMALGVHADIWEELAHYTMSDEPKPPPVQVQELITRTPADEMGPMEDQLIAIVASGESTPEAKWFSCRMLQRIGTEKCVPTLAALLTDEILSHYARLTLERIPASRLAGKALIDALDQAPDPLKIGIMGSLGERGDEHAVKRIARYTGSDNVAVAAAALQALGKIGGKQARQAITRAKRSTTPDTDGIPGGFQFAQVDALLRCAEGMGDAKGFASIYTTATSDAHRAAALRGLVQTDEAKASPRLTALLKEQDSYLRDTAFTLIRDEGGPILTAAVSETLDTLNQEQQVHVIRVLGNRGDPSALAAIVPFIDTTEEEVSQAAITSAAQLGDGSTVGLLLSRAGDTKTDAVVTAIASMTNPAVDQALLAALARDNLVIAAARALGAREVAEARPALTTLTAHSDEAVQIAGWNALGILAQAEDLDGLMKTTLALEDTTVRHRAEACLKQVCSRVADKHGCIEAIGTYYGGADVSDQLFILDLAAIAGSPNGLTYVRAALTSGNKALYDKAVRALAAWSEPGQVYTDLLVLAQNPPDEKTGIVALRGYITQGTREGNKKKCLEMLSTAGQLAKRTEEKRLLIASADRWKEAMFVPFIRAYVDDPAVTAEARLALLNKADHFIRQKKVPAGITETLQIIVNDPASSADRIKQAEKELNRIRKLSE